jgi:hypothetical protein
MLSREAKALLKKIEEAVEAGHAQVYVCVVGETSAWREVEALLHEEDVKKECGVK